MSDKKKGIALALWFFLGFLSAHRFYTGKTGSAVLQIVTLGGLGVWWLIDGIMLLTGKFEDSEGKALA